MGNIHKNRMSEKALANLEDTIINALDGSDYSTFTIRNGGFLEIDSKEVNDDRVRNIHNLIAGMITTIAEVRLHDEKMGTSQSTGVLFRRLTPQDHNMIKAKKKFKDALGEAASLPPREAEALFNKISEVTHAALDDEIGKRRGI